MSDLITPIATWCAAIIETIGIVVITVFALYALAASIVRILRRQNNILIFQEVRQSLGRGILLGLEFLIAADIIYTVAVELTFKTVGVLAVVVLIRTFLSLTLEVEITGRWPWQDNVDGLAKTRSTAAGNVVTP